MTLRAFEIAAVVRCRLPSTELNGACNKWRVPLTMSARLTALNGPESALRSSPMTWRVPPSHACRGQRVRSES
jgi:hypothetical protein